MQCPDALSAEGEEGVADGENAFAAVPNRLRDEAMLKATGFHILPREADKVCFLFTESCGYDQKLKSV